jgi:hypothetical protein
LKSPRIAPLAAHAEKVNLTYLTHWSPESVAMLEKAATAYGKDHPDVSIAVRAVPFGDLLTTLRASGGGHDTDLIYGEIASGWFAPRRSTSIFSRRECEAVPDNGAAAPSLGAEGSCQSVAQRGGQRRDVVGPDCPRAA